RPVVPLCVFSSRRRHTRFSRDWSSDVCSSDLPVECPHPTALCAVAPDPAYQPPPPPPPPPPPDPPPPENPDEEDRGGGTALANEPCVALTMPATDRAKPRPGQPSPARQAGRQALAASCPGGARANADSKASAHGFSTPSAMA